MRSMGAIAIAASIMTGCTADRSYHDLIGGRDLNQLNMDGATCQMSLQQSPVGEAAPTGSNTRLTIANAGTRMIEQDNFLDSCMLSRGWERR